MIDGAASSDLKRTLIRDESTSLTIGRLRLPRIRYTLYWPPGERALHVVVRRQFELLKQRKFDVSALSALLREETTFAYFGSQYCPPTPRRTTAQGRSQRRIPIDLKT